MTYTPDQWQEAIVALANAGALSTNDGTFAKETGGVLGATADPAVTGDTAGSLSAKSRGWSKMLFDMWDSTNHWLQVKVMNANANGQATMLNSAPVVLASDQSKVPTKAASGDFATGAITDLPAKGAAATSASMPVNIASDQVVPIKRSAVAAYSLASTTTSGSTQNSGDIAVGLYTEMSIDINVTAQAGTNPTLQFFYERKGADGVYYVLWQTTALTAATQVYTTSIGAGMAYNQSLGSTGRLRWVIGGTATPTFTFSANLTGK